MPILVQSFSFNVKACYGVRIVFSTTYLDGVGSSDPEEGMSPEEHEFDMWAYSIPLMWKGHQNFNFTSSMTGALAVARHMTLMTCLSWMDLINPTSGRENILRKHLVLHLNNKMLSTIKRCLSKSQICAEDFLPTWFWTSPDFVALDCTHCKFRTIALIYGIN